MTGMSIVALHHPSKPQSSSRYPIARPETTTEILTRALALCPELAPPDVRSAREPVVDDLRPLIVEEGCGFRPARKGGINFDTLWTSGPQGKIPVLCNYG